VFLAAGFFGGCSDASFNGSSGVVRKPGGPKKPKTPKDPTSDANPNSVKVRYGQGVKPAVADFLFVLDNSVSMSGDAARVSQGLMAIPKETFPDSTRLAVMTTMAASNPTAASLTVHPDIKGYGSCINKEPGFLSFVDRASYDAFKKCSGLPWKQNMSYLTPPCESGWFEPFATNGAGIRCFTAALQNPFHPVGCEPGLLAVEQLLQRNVGKPLFRDNATVSVIFISDEQEGCNASDTRGNVTNPGGTADRLKDLIQKNSKVASVKFHAIAPPIGTKDTPMDTLTYQAVVQHLGGTFFNIQTQTNYNSMINKLITDPVDKLEPEFFVPATAKKITSVTVDGVATTNYQFNAESSKVTVQGLDSSKQVEIEIKYQ
jgi:hypothetical protein